MRDPKVTSISRARRYRGRPMADGLGPLEEPLPRDPDDFTWPHEEEVEYALPTMLGEPEPLL